MKDKIVIHYNASFNASIRKRRVGSDVSERRERRSKKDLAPKMIK